MLWPSECHSKISCKLLLNCRIYLPPWAAVPVVKPESLGKQEFVATLEPDGEIRIGTDGKAPSKATFAPEARKTEL